ncbi:MAG: DUF4112 domain-containing protein [Asticcacaulis sp.]
MFVRSQQAVDKLYNSVGLVKRLSDGLIKIGPVNVIGLDGILAWVPGVPLGAIYSVSASTFIMVQALRARISPFTFVKTLLILLADSGLSSVTSLIPFLPAAADTLFQGHLYASHIVQKEIEKTWYIDGSQQAAYDRGLHEDNLAALKKMRGKKRLVYLRP